MTRLPPAAMLTSGNAAFFPPDQNPCYKTGALVEQTAFRLNNHGSIARDRSDVFQAAYCLFKQYSSVLISSAAFDCPLPEISRVESEQTFSFTST